MRYICQLNQWQLSRATVRSSCGILPTNLLTTHEEMMYSLRSREMFLRLHSLLLSRRSIFMASPMAQIANLFRRISPEDGWSWLWHFRGVMGRPKSLVTMATQLTTASDLSDNHMICKPAWLKLRENSGTR